MQISNLIERRERVLSPVYYHFFDEMKHLVKGEGMWLWDSDGRKYLDFYNNVPSVGHCHPDVVEALVRQAGQLNVSTRYLDEAIIEFAEALNSKLPNHLDNCVFACSGTEANDLAIQMARHISGNHGVLVAEMSYHGNSDLVLKLSTDSYPAEDRPSWLATFEVPDPYRGVFADHEPGTGDMYLNQAREQLDAMAARGHAPAALLVDCSFEAHGVVKPPEGYMSELCKEVRSRGGLIIADEVQSGYCRMGKHWWGFEHHDIVPDIVTCGKPMGGGHPISALMSSRDHAAKFASKYEYFNTTGGNPVSSAVGLAVINVIDRDNLLETATDTGGYLANKLAKLADQYEVVGTTRGYGLFQGLDLVTEAQSKTPITKKQLRHVTTLLAEEGLITGTSGRYGNVLKLRPPLPASREHVDIAIDAIDRGLTRFEQSL